MSIDGADSPPNEGHKSVADVASGAEQLIQGLVEAVWKSETFDWLIDNVEDNRLAVRQLVHNLHDLERQVADVERQKQIAEQRIRDLEQQLQAERERSAALEERVAELER